MRPFVIQAKAILGLNLRRNAPCLSSTVSRFLNSPWFVQDPHKKYEGPTNQRRQFASMYTNGQKHELNEKQGESRVIDLRSDTVTKPTKEMRAAIAAAEVGDDVYGDDPTVNALQTKAAELTEKEAALFVTSGTMGNLAAVMAHCTGHD